MNAPIHIEGGNWFSILPATNRVIVSIGDDLGCFNATADDLLSELSGVENIELSINSHGGCSRTAIRLFDGMFGRVSKATLIGACQSSAFILAQSAKRIEAEINCRLMVHRPCMCVYGQAEDLRDAANSLDKISARFGAILAGRSDHSAIASTWLDGRDHFLDSSEAKLLGLVDEVFSIKAALPQSISGVCSEAETDDALFAKQFFNATRGISVKDKAAMIAYAQRWIDALK